MSTRNNTNKIEPREIADKSIEGNLQRAITMALEVESDAVKMNTQSFNNNRYKATSNIDDYNDLKDTVRQIKENSINNLPKLLEQLENSITLNGGHFYLAKTAEEANNYISNICKKKKAKLVVKAKSITSEEIKLNDHLEKIGIEVAETDLAEFILQVANEQPSHIVAPAIHRSRERISDLFKEKFETNLPLETGEDLTKFARDILRNKFLTADIGISGANVIAADSGTLLLVESEGNIRMVTQAPSVHIAIAGVEKVIPARKDLWYFLELLAPSATGQNLTSYTHIIKPLLSIPPFAFYGQEKKSREFHLVLIDNGRMAMRDDNVLKDALYCIRCSACMNVCANFQAVGGHAFGGETYPGGIGGSWEVGTGILENGLFSDLCTGCSRCVTECPVKIDIPWLNENIRDRLNKKNVTKPLSNVIKSLFPIEKADNNATLQRQFFANYSTLAKLGSKAPNILNKIVSTRLSKILAEKILNIESRRELPKFKKETLIDQISSIYNYNTEKQNDLGVLLFADSFTNYSRSNVGVAAYKIFNKFGINISISAVGNEGRDSLSQGLLETSKKRANKTADYLLEFINDGYEIIVPEPSILALFRKDYSHLVDKHDFERIKSKSYDPFEYLLKYVRMNNINLSDYFNVQDVKKQPKLFYHSHCQQRSINAEKATEIFLTELGFQIETSTVECCGMAGSFGYKKQYYDLSVKVGEDLVNQIKESDNTNGDMVVLTSGISCHEQINDLSEKNNLHPLEYIIQFFK